MWLQIILIFVAAPCLEAKLHITARDQVHNHLKDSTFSWNVTSTRHSNEFRGLSAVSTQILWVAGTSGTVLRSMDSGRHWQDVSPKLQANESHIDFRALKAWSANDAMVMSINKGPGSGIFVTKNGGETWERSFINHESTSYLDCLWFKDSNHGMALLDPVDGVFGIIETLDGGSTWTTVKPIVMPVAKPGETGMAASNTCLTHNRDRWYIVTGGIDPGRVFRSEDGYEWQVDDSIISGGPTGGVQSISFDSAGHGIMVGGDYSQLDSSNHASAWTDDGGLTWHAAAKPPSGYRSGSVWIPGLPKVAIAVGPTGSDFTVDGGKVWLSFDDMALDSIVCTDAGSCWASGPNGMIARLVVDLNSAKNQHGVVVSPSCGFI